jgi:hypothetical protein
MYDKISPFENNEYFSIKEDVYDRRKCCSV